MIYGYGEPQCNDIDRGKLKNIEKNLSQCLFVHHIYNVDTWMRIWASAVRDR
jgi:hypothetical protein